MKQTLRELKREQQGTKEALKAGIGRVRSQQETTNRALNIRVNELLNEQRSAQPAVQGSAGRPKPAMTMGEFKAQCAAWKWFHAIDFGEFASSGRFRPGQPQNITLFGAMEFLKDIDLDGATVLDIGTMDGIAAFGAKRLGAEKVVATDSSRRQPFEGAQSVLGLDGIDYRPGLQVRDFATTFARSTFDVILSAGVMYHMLHPISAFTECRKIIKDGGLLIMETVYTKDDERAALFLNSSETMVNEIWTYSVPTKKWVIEAMKMAGFDVLAVRTISGPDRITVLGRACDPSQVRERSPILVRMHDMDFEDFEFTKSTWVPARAMSQVRYTGPGGERQIDYRTHEPEFPYHPPKDRPVVGHTAWLTPAGNR